MLFIFNGFLYYDKNSSGTPYSKEYSRSYNVILGLSLLGVVIFPHKDGFYYPILHFISAGIFYLGSIFAIGFYSEKRHRKINYLIAFIALLGILSHFIFPKYITLFWAEWVSLIVIAIHYIMESKGIVTVS